MASQYIVYFLYNTEKSYKFQGRLQKEVDKEKKTKQKHSPLLMKY